MNVQDYISSGIVESYVLGLASHEEQAEFERMCGQYPEVLAARTNFEIAMEHQAMQNSVAPPPALKQQIKDLILPPEARIIPMNRDASVKKSNEPAQEGEGKSMIIR